MPTLEGIRDLSEDLEVIEAAVAERFGRNPQLYYSSGLQQMREMCGYKVAKPGFKTVKDNAVYAESRAKQPRKQVVAQMFEIRLFLDDYYKKQRSLGQMRRGLSVSKPDLSQLKRDIETVSGGTTLHEKREEYAMFTAPRPSVLSRRAADLDVNKVFSREEQYGLYFDLEPLLGTWQSALRSSECNVHGFATQLHAFLDPQTYLRKPVVDRKSPRYASLVHELSQYIESFFYKRYCLIDKTVVESRLTREFEKEYTAAGVSCGTPGKLFCTVCSKQYALSVFPAHIPGKAHQKLLHKHKTMLLHEFKLHKYLVQVQEELQSTTSLLERLQALTPQERASELAEVDKAYNEPTYTPQQDDEESSEPQDTMASMPVGPDGVPMPFWLYKLQGLDVSFPCEICGNERFQGRRSFDRHFSGAKHQLRLRCLGIEPSPAFRGISAIDDALKLAQVGQKSPDEALVVQAEDRSGNVLAQTDYDDLRRQGLL